ncbi:hypothetical protein [Streptomyces agglomeratus]|nr:hypothetical protein [Streptomyces agglomeratus]
MTPVEKAFLTSYALGDSRRHRKWGYERRDMEHYAQSVKTKMRARTKRWPELVYRAVVHQEIPPPLPRRTEVSLDDPMLWTVSGLAAGWHSADLAAELGMDAPAWSVWEKRLLNRVQASTIPHTVYLCARLIPWPWTLAGEWDALKRIPNQSGLLVRSH